MATDKDPQNPEFQRAAAEHRRLTRLKEEYESLGNRVSGLGEPILASAAWRQAAVFHERRIELKTLMDALRREAHDAAIRSR